MAKETLNTIEDLVQYAVARPSYDVKFEIGQNSHYEYDDPAAGNKWEDEHNQIWLNHVKRDWSRPIEQQPEYQAFQAKTDAHDELKPNMHTVWTYELRSEKYSGGSTLIISKELADALDGIWTKKTSKWSKEPKRVGKLTLKGMLTRLGRTDIKEQINDANKKAELTRQKNQRNYVRVHITKTLEELGEYVEDHGAEIGVSTDMFNLPVALQDLLREEE